jgi:hypothetical protein
VGEPVLAGAMHLRPGFVSDRILCSNFLWRAPDR